MRNFSPSDLIRLRGKVQKAVELLFVEWRDASLAAKVLFTTIGALWVLISRARKILADLGISLPDRRHALAIGASGDVL